MRHRIRGRLAQKRGALVTFALPPTAPPPRVSWLSTLREYPIGTEERTLSSRAASSASVMSPNAMLYNMRQYERSKSGTSLHLRSEAIISIDLIRDVRLAEIVGEHRMPILPRQDGAKAPPTADDNTREGTLEDRVPHIQPSISPGSVPVRDLYAVASCRSIPLRLCLKGRSPHHPTDLRREVRGRAQLWIEYRSDGLSGSSSDAREDLVGFERTTQFQCLTRAVHELRRRLRGLSRG